MKLKSTLAVVLCAFVAYFCQAQKATVSTLDSGKLRVEVTSNAANGLKALVDTALVKYNAANGSTFTSADIEELKVGGNIVAFNADFTKGTVKNIVDLIVGDTGDDASYIWSNMRKTLKRLDLSAANFNAHFAVKNADGDTISLNIPINVIPPKAFWRGVDIDTDLLPTASEKLKNGMTALEEVKLPSSLMGFDKNTIKMLGTMLKGFIADSNIADTVIKYITEDNADAFLGIGDYAFAHATSLKSISIPYSAFSPVRGIGAKAFYNDKSLASVTFEKGNSFFSKGGTGINYICSKAFALTALTEVNLPQETDSIAQGAFLNCANLATVNFEGTNAVRYIGDYAFMGTAISSIKLPSKVAYIGDEALRDCKSLNSVEILGTDSLTMGEKVFYNTPNMKNGTFICSRTVVPTAHELKKKSIFNAYDGTFAGLGSSKTATAVQHGTLIINAEKPVSEIDGTLNITIPENLRKAYCKAPGWCDLLISPTSTLGDVNEDGNVDASDATALINKILGLLNLDDTACDINADGTVDVSDVTSLITLILNQ